LQNKVHQEVKIPSYLIAFLFAKTCVE
jgi:hypothetical protein